MARVSGERAPAFTSEELEKLVDGVFPQYKLLYGPPDKQAHQKKGIWRAIAKEVRTLGVYHSRSTQGGKRWEDVRRLTKKMVEAQLGLASQCGAVLTVIVAAAFFHIPDVLVDTPTWGGPEVRAPWRPGSSWSVECSWDPERRSWQPKRTKSTHRAQYGEKIDATPICGRRNDAPPALRLNIDACQRHDRRINARSWKNDVQHSGRRLGDRNPHSVIFESSCGWISDTSTVGCVKTTQGLPEPKSADRMNARSPAERKTMRPDPTKGETAQGFARD
ncbi:hypothetical protein NDU88_003308 [Pleurodeles waltl]|uniref:Myb/SANT-like DNA-binding domain-containing protein n=1 Tax=Pleurodeles waltl TaxID=8319 RepID=A0AAV7NGB0_PLEWA|nr:hypothetical protein NDU88_003308 [Pleurodeles waltl]